MRNRTRIILVVLWLPYSHFVCLLALHCYEHVLHGSRYWCRG